MYQRSLWFVVPLMVLIAGCGGGDGGDGGIQPTPSPSPTASPTASPTPTTSPTPVPSPTPTPAPPSEDALKINQAVFTISEANDTGDLPIQVVNPYNESFAIGASRGTGDQNGKAAQVNVGDVESEQNRAITIAVGDSNGIQPGQAYDLGGVTSEVKDKSAFVVFSTRGVTNTSGSFKQWHSAGGGQVIVERYEHNILRVKLINAHMVPYTATSNSGQTGTFVLSGTGFSAVQ